MIKVVLVDDHVVVRSGFAQLLNLEDDLVVEGQPAPRRAIPSRRVHAPRPGLR